MGRARQQSPPLTELQERFVQSTLASGLAAHTARIRQAAVSRFVTWAEVHGVTTGAAITRSTLEAYQLHLLEYRKANGQPLAPATRVARFDPIRAFCKWLRRSGHVSVDPATDVTLARLPARFPARVLTESEVAGVLSLPDVRTPLGVRDRAILETLYATGIRRMELVNLELRDHSPQEGMLLVRRGKGGRARWVPLGPRANGWILRYLADVRGARHLHHNLFLSLRGEALVKNRLGDLVKAYLAAARIEVVGACHLFRHACATHMLENGADIRYIQALLGHVSLSTTQLYTRVSVSKLREVHARTHPAVLRFRNRDSLVKVR